MIKYFMQLSAEALEDPVVDRDVAKTHHGKARDELEESRKVSRSELAKSTEGRQHTVERLAELVLTDHSSGDPNPLADVLDVWRHVRAHRAVRLSQECLEYEARRPFSLGAGDVD